MRELPIGLLVKQRRESAHDLIDRLADGGLCEAVETLAGLVGFYCDRDQIVTEVIKSTTLKATMAPDVTRPNFVVDDDGGLHDIQPDWYRWTLEDEGIPGGALPVSWGWKITKLGTVVPFPTEPVSYPK